MALVSLGRAVVVFGPPLPSAVLRLLPLVAALALAACDATNVVPAVGQAGAPEAVDSLRLVVTGAPTVSIRAVGLGGTPTLTPDTLVLNAKTTYSGFVDLGGDLDAEVQAEAESHLYTFAFDSDDATLRRTDRESQYAVENLNGGDYPLGRTFTIVTDASAAGTGRLTVRLSHFDGAPKAGADDTSGSDDLVLTVPVRYVPAAP